MRCSPAVLVLDMRMPKMTGLDLQKALIEKDWPLPIIYMSGDSESQEIIDAMKLGAVDFLWKPITHTQLIQVKKHRAHIMAKMEVSSLAELLSLCKDFIPTCGDDQTAP
jgi:FixJ family two-component response regulator